MIWPKDQSGLGIKQYLGQKADLKFEFLGLAKRLLGVRVIWPKDSLVLGLNQHQGVIWPNPKTHILSQLYKGLNIALSPNLIGSSDVDFHRDSESGLNT